MVKLLRWMSFAASMATLASAIVALISFFQATERSASPTMNGILTTYRTCLQPFFIRTSDITLDWLGPIYSSNSARISDLIWGVGAAATSGLIVELLTRPRSEK